MRPTSVLTGLVAAAAALVLAAPLSAEDTTGPTRIKRLEMSRQMYQIGVADRDPLMVIAAAKLRKSVSVTYRERAPEGGTAQRSDPMSAESMLQVAAVLAEGDTLLQTLVDDARLYDVKGVIDGPVFSSTAIAAQKTDRYPQIPFRGGDFAEIYVEGKGQSDLDLLVYDGANRLVCSDTDVTDKAYCRWKPDDTTHYTIQVVNKGNGTEYALYTN